MLAGAGGGGGGGGGAAEVVRPPGIADVTEFVDKKGSFALNVVGSTTANDVLSGVCCTSDAGPSLIFHLPFTETLKLTSLRVLSLDASECREPV